MKFGLFVYAGFIIKVAFDYLDKDLLNARAIKSWVLGFIVASLFYGINCIVTVEKNATNDWSLGAFLLCFAFIGYLAPHLFLKGATWFDKRTDEKLTVTQITTVEKTGETPKL